ncbi:hypothetical protein AAZX31_16G129700 [Glycine max]|uniref:Uncharacterized protein n=3 Tax=Glycine subgen. Soja TaxID=1462606 RepID=K7MHD6_SOYBN|nr:hypothetical protein GYH30_045100 [Glycine max]KRH08366.1 hypothetical protein GLYMA_16G144400v4 [Glycine max]RZB61063.1 hypothetical protein D0Y65_043709 [Glycine soja]
MEESKWKLNGNEETKVDSKSCPMYIYHVPQSHNFNLLNYYPIPYIGAQILKEKAKRGRRPHQRLVVSWERDHRTCYLFSHDLI